jgi:ectoine hydroxylase
MSTAHARLDRYPSRLRAQGGIIDRADPVVWCGPDREGPLGLDALAAYERDGYLFVPDLFSAAEVEQILAEVRRLAADPEVAARPQTITERGSNIVRSIFEIHRSSPLFAGLAADQRLAGVARQILDDDVYIHQSRVNIKPGFHGREFYWHSDFETWHTEDGMPAMRALSVAVALTDNNEHNGPLMVMPGSHRSYVACVGETPEQNYKSSLQAQEIGTPDPDSLTNLADQLGIVAPKGAAGSVVFFDCNTMHGSNSNITPFARTNAFLVYNSVSNALEEPFAAPGTRPEYIAHREYTDPV